MKLHKILKMKVVPNTENETVKGNIYKFIQYLCQGVSWFVFNVKFVYKIFFPHFSLRIQFE